MAPIAMKTNTDLWKEVDILPMLMSSDKLNSTASLPTSSTKAGKNKKVLFATEKESLNGRILSRVSFLFSSVELAVSENFCCGKNAPVSEQHIFIKVHQLKPKDVFGLINIVFDSVGQSTSCSLISEGSECILIDRAFFINNMSESYREMLGKTVISFLFENSPNAPEPVDLV
jgi:hypothetical protein